MMIVTLSASIRRKSLRLLSFLLFILDIGLFTTAGNTRLTCDRAINNKIQCSIKQTLSLGIIPRASQTIDEVKSVKLKEHRQIYDQVTEGEPPRAKDRRAYGILLIGERQILLNGYDYNRDRQEQRLQNISAFLQNSDPQQFVLELKNFGSTVMTVLALGGAIALFVLSQRNELDEAEILRRTYIPMVSQYRL